MGEKKRYTIAIVLGNSESEYFAKLMEGFCSCAKKEDVNLLFLNGPHLPDYCREILTASFGWDYEYQFHTIYDYVHFAKPDALIVAYGLLASFRDMPDVDTFVDRFSDIPCLVLGDQVKDPKISSVTSGNLDGMRKCVEHLIVDHGYQKIAFMAGPDRNFDSNQRLQVYKEVMAEHGLTVKDTMIAHGNYTENVDAEVEFLLDHNPGLEAIAFANDGMAKGGYRVCAARNLVVGRDIAITGYDDSEIAKTVEPALTSVSHNSYLLGYRAVQAALKLCRGEQTETVNVETFFCKRTSCGCKTNAINIKENRTRDEMNALKMEIIESNRRNWFIPSFTMDLINGKMDMPEQMRHIMKRLQAMGVKSAYLFFFREAIVHHKDEKRIQFPEEIYLTAHFDEENIYCHGAKDLIPVRKERGFARLFPQDRPHSYMAFPIFAREEQYGLLLCEAEQKEYLFMLLCSMQLGAMREIVNINMRERKMKQELEEKNRILNYISAYDELSQLLNRRGFMEKAIQTIRKEHGKHACLLFADVDHLKEINDCFGHAAGDFTIRTAAEYLRQCVPANAVTARIGGDEFVSLIVTDYEEIDCCNILKKRLEKYACDFNKACDQPFYIEMSVGVHEFICDYESDILELLKKSDAVLYEQKKNRRSSMKKEV